MNDWYPDLLVAQRKIADRVAEADRERLARWVTAHRSPFRLRVHLDFQVTFGRAAGGQASKPV
jgi:hypothetical protein